MTAECDRSIDEIAVWAGLPAFLQQRRQLNQKLLVGKARKPWIVEHDEIVSAGARFEIYQFFLKKICIRKRGDLDVDVCLLFIVEGRLLQRLAFNSRDHGNSELLSNRLRVPRTTAEPN